MAPVQGGAPAPGPAPAKAPGRPASDVARARRRWEEVSSKPPAARFSRALRALLFSFAAKNQIFLCARHDYLITLLDPSPNACLLSAGGGGGGQKGGAKSEDKYSDDDKNSDDRKGRVRANIERARVLSSVYLWRLDFTLDFVLFFLQSLPDYHPTRDDFFTTSIDDVVFSRER